jgi:hypothetical protein
MEYGTLAGMAAVWKYKYFGSTITFDIAQLSREKLD